METLPHESKGWVGKGGVCWGGGGGGGLLRTPTSLILAPTNAMTGYVIGLWKLSANSVTGSKFVTDNSNLYQVFPKSFDIKLFLPWVDTPRVCMSALALRYFHSLISTQTFGRV